MTIKQLLKRDRTIAMEVIEKYRECNIYCDWFNPTIENFCEVMEKSGFEIDPQDVSFRGFWSQGDGASFVGSINALDFLRTNRKLTQFPKVVRAMREGKIEEIVAISRATHQYCHENTTYVEDFETYDEITSMCEDELEELQDYLEEKRKEWSQDLYKTLEDEYNSLTSNEAVIEFLTENEIYIEEL